MAHAVEEAIVGAKAVYEWVTGQPAPESASDAPYARIPPEVDHEEHVVRQAATLLERVQRIAPIQSAQQTMSSPRPGWPATTPTPYAAVRGQNEVRYLFDLAGVAKARISVELRGTTLQVSADRPAIAVSRDEQLVGQPSWAARSERTVQLPIPVAGDQVSASFADGLLTVRVCMPSVSEQPIKIEVR